MSADPRMLIAQSPMRPFQIVAVTLCIFLYALDGFDVLSISFASPGIAAEWGIDRAALGIVLSMELIGMAVGSILIGMIADIFGRRPTILLCLVVMGSGMYLASLSGSAELLSVYRFYTGLGIGGMLASVNAMAAEYSNDRNKNLSVILMATGYPIGVIFGGSVASILLASFEWRAIFVFGSAVTVVFIPLVWFLLPESIEFLMSKRPKDWFNRLNATLGRIGHPAIESPPAVREEKAKIGITRLFAPDLARITVLLTIAYLAHIMTFYFILKWIPKIVVDMGFSPSLAGGVLVWANVGGALGSVILGILTQRFSVRVLILGVFLFSFVMVSIFGRGYDGLEQLSLIAAAAGFFTNSAVVGLYAVFARAFPTEVRAGGTGFVIGVGRGGAALGPIIAGFLFASGFGLQQVAIAMAAGSLIAFAAIILLPKGEQKLAASQV